MLQQRVISAVFQFDSSGAAVVASRWHHGSLLFSRHALFAKCKLDTFLYINTYYSFLWKTDLLLSLPLSFSRPCFSSSFSSHFSDLFLYLIVFFVLFLCYFLIFFFSSPLTKQSCFLSLPPPLTASRFHFSFLSTLSCFFLFFFPFSFFFFFLFFFYSLFL